jgi:flagellar biosynthesis protein FliP
MRPVHITADRRSSQAGESLPQAFMIRQTREATLMFADMAGGEVRQSREVPFSILLPGLRHQRAEDRLPDRLHAVPAVPGDRPCRGLVLMSLGMMMLSPTIISLPFKLLLFVLVDGWALLMGSLAMSFG